MKVLWCGDIVGSPGRRVFAEVAHELKRDNRVQAIVANGENSAAGSGITADIAEELFKAGADVITLGDHVWGQKGTEQFLSQERRVIRPANLPAACPGVGFTTIQTALGPFTVVSLVGRVFMNPAECPFLGADAVLKRIPGGSGPILVEIHAEATSEKIALGRYLDGRVAAVAGTHTHVPTNDAQILPNGTAYITDLGMTGTIDSVIGRQVAPVLHKFTTGMPQKFEVAKGAAVLQGVILDIDRVSAKVVSIESFIRREVEAGKLAYRRPYDLGKTERAEGAAEIDER